MVQFLEDSQLFLKLFGHCAYDPLTSENASRYRWSNTVNRFLNFLFVYLIGSSLIFISDEQQPYNERIRSTIQVVILMEQFLVHLEFSKQKTRVFEFFNHFEMIANQSMCGKLKKLFWDFLTQYKCLGATETVIDFYLEAERKTKSVRNGACKKVVQPYGVVLTLSFIFTVIKKIIIENGASDPITWYVPYKVR